MSSLYAKSHRFETAIVNLRSVRPAGVKKPVPSVSYTQKPGVRCDGNYLEVSPGIAALCMRR